jgi:hypothetical protein
VAERLFVKNPGATLTGDAIEANCQESAQPRKWFRFWE